MQKLNKLHLELQRDSVDSSPSTAMFGLINVISRSKEHGK